MEVQKIVQEFVDDKLSQDKSLIGAIFYGSNCYHTAKEDSDIDLLFLSNGKNLYRGCTIYQGKRVEYFIKPSEILIEECKNPDSSLYSIFKNGQIISDKSNVLNQIKAILELRDHHTIQIYQKEIEKKDTILKQWQELNNAQEQSNQSFWIIYFNLLDTLRKIYQGYFGLTETPVCKIKELYQNRKYAEQYYSSILPPLEFTEEYLKFMQEKDQKIGLENIRKMAKFLSIELPEISFSKNFVEHFKESFYQIPTKSNLLEQAAILTTKYTKTKIALQENSLDADFLYAIVIELLRKYYEVQCSILTISTTTAIFNYQQIQNQGVFTKTDQDFASLYLKAISAQTPQEKIIVLNELYQFSLKDIPFQSDEYCIRINGISRQKKI